MHKHLSKYSYNFQAVSEGNNKKAEDMENQISEII